MRVDAVRCVALLAVEARDQVRGELGEIVGAVAQRRQLDADDREALVEVGAELAARDELAEIAVGRGDDAEVDLAPLALAEPADTT